MDKNDTCSQGGSKPSNINKEQKTACSWGGRDSQSEFSRSYLRMLGLHVLLAPVGGIGVLMLLAGSFVLGILGVPIALMVYVWKSEGFSAGIAQINNILHSLTCSSEQFFYECLMPSVWCWGIVGFFVSYAILVGVLVPYWKSKVRRVRDMGDDAYSRVIYPIITQSTVSVLQVLSIVVLSYPHLKELFLPALLHSVGIYILIRCYVLNPYEASLADLPEEKAKRIKSSPLFRIFVLLFALSLVVGVVMVAEPLLAYMIILNTILVLCIGFTRFIVPLFLICYRVKEAWVCLSCLVCKSRPVSGIETTAKN